MALLVRSANQGEGKTCPRGGAPGGQGSPASLRKKRRGGVQFVNQFIYYVNISIVLSGEKVNGKRKEKTGKRERLCPSYAIMYSAKCVKKQERERYGEDFDVDFGEK